VLTFYHRVANFKENRYTFPENVYVSGPERRHLCIESKAQAMKTKVILVTGASSGIGKATAEQLLAEGHIVYGAARRVEKMQSLEAAGGTAITMDITVEDAVKQAVEQIISEQGRIDVLVNNAGYAVYGPVETVDMDDARRQFEVNIFGLARLTQEVLPHMRAAGSGTIINLSSMGGKIYTPYGAWYHASKHALEGWSDCLRLELKPFGIDVVIIEPGLIKTEFGEVMLQPMIDRAKGTAYEDQVLPFAKTSQEAYEKPGETSPPSRIAREISKAIRAKTPKTRYAAGKMAKMLMRTRTFVSDRFFDRLLLRQVKN
jgi:short-subunit dehydrogenase